MAKRKPADGKSVWIEYPESVHVRATYDATADAFVLKDGKAVPVTEVGGWSQRNPEKKKAAEQPNIIVRFFAGAVQAILDSIF